LNRLPNKCIAYFKGIDSFVLITKNVAGFVPVLDMKDDYIKSFNDEYNITPLIIEAMLVGAIKGWQDISIAQILRGGECDK
jgi:hypothetical protein